MTYVTYAYVEDPKKQAAKGRALNQTQMAEQGISQLLSEVRSLISHLDYALGGAPSGLDRMLIGQCQSAESDLLSAQGQLSAAAGAISSLDTCEQVSAETVNGG